MSKEEFNGILCLGIIFEKVRKTLEETQEIDCSRCNPNWQSEYLRESELLDEARQNISYLKRIIEEIYEMRGELQQ